MAFRVGAAEAEVQYIHLLVDSSLATGGGSDEAAADSLREERLRMVIERLHGPQTHYRAAQKFLKNRTLRKMSGNNGMTLYDRIMAYRKLKEGEEVDEDYSFIYLFIYLFVCLFVCLFICFKC